MKIRKVYQSWRVMIRANIASSQSAIRAEQRVIVCHRRLIVALRAELAKCDRAEKAASIVNRKS